MVRRDPFDVDPFEDINKLIKKLINDINYSFGEGNRISISFGPKPTLDIDSEIIDTPETPINYEIQETDNEIILIVELHGIKENDFTTKITKNSVLISVKRSDDGFYEERSLNISLPKEVIPEKAKTSFNNGILEIILPKKQ